MKKVRATIVIEYYLEETSPKLDYPKGTDTSNNEALAEAEKGFIGRRGIDDEIEYTIVDIPEVQVLDQKK